VLAPVGGGSHTRRAGVSCGRHGKFHADAGRTMKTLKCFCVLALVVIAGLPVSVFAQQQPQQQQRQSPYPAFYAFGDSLADNGNDFIVTQLFGQVPPVPPSVSPHRSYFAGRFSNGPVAFEYLWQMLSGAAPGTRGSLRPFLQLPFVVRNQAIDFAFGGSSTGFIDQTPGGFGVPGLLGQIELFRAVLPKNPQASRALYAILAGAGDYLRPTPLSPTQSVGNIIAGVQSLYNSGARTIIVINLPDLGAIPITAGTPQSALLTQLSLAHNALLAQQLAALQASLPDLDLLAIDVNAVLQQLPPSVNTQLPALDALLPPLPGLPPASVCIFTAPATCRDVPTFDVGLQFLFWDAEHPTTAVHRLLAEHIYSQLQQLQTQTQLRTQ
jgi:phospholipase/lecithinase/hemolysin